MAQNALPRVAVSAFSYNCAASQAPASRSRLCCRLAARATCCLGAPAMGRKGKPAPKPKAAEPPGEWLRQSAQRLEAQAGYLRLDGERRYFAQDDLERWQWWHGRSWRGWRGWYSNWGGDPWVSLPPPWVASEPRWAWSDAQRAAWQEDFVPPTGGLRPGGQPRTQEEEIHRMVTGKVTMLNFCPSNRAVMICGRPVVVPLERQYVGTILGVCRFTFEIDQPLCPPK